MKQLHQQTVNERPLAQVGSSSSSFARRPLESVLTTKISRFTSLPKRSTVLGLLLGMMLCSWADASPSELTGVTFSLDDVGPNNNSYLYTINQLTGAVSNQRDTGVHQLIGLARSPGSSNLAYGITTPNVVGASNLYSINIHTGQSTLIGSTGADCLEGDLAFDSTGVLYATGIEGPDFPFKSYICQIATNTGRAGTPVQVTGSPNGQSGGLSDFSAMAFDADNKLWIIDNGVSGAGSNDPTYLLKVNQLTGEVISYVALSQRLGGSSGMAFDPCTGVLWIGDGTELGTNKVYTANTNTGLLTLVGATGLPSTDGLSGLSFAPCDPCGTEPLVLCKFDDSVNIGYDTSGYGHDGVLGAATVVSAPCGYALNFLPDNGVDEFTIPHSPDLNLMGAMSGMALIRPLGQQSNGNPSCTEGTIFSKGGNYWFQVEKHNNELVFQNEGSGTDLAIANIALCIGEWTHVAFVREADGKTIHFYKNGLPIGSPTTLSLLASPNTDPLMVGNYGFGNSPAGCQFNGDLDEIRIYDRALSDAEILSVYLCGCPIVECSPPIIPFCFPGIDNAPPCPCMNPPSVVGRGCDNSSATGGAQLTALGAASLAADTLQFTSSGEKPTATSVFLQGTSQIATGVAFGQGVRCVGGSLKRLYVHNASAGTVSAPIGADASVSARSAALGHSIAVGETLYYMVYYRDPILLGGCSSTNTFNATQGLSVLWAP